MAKKAATYPITVRIEAAFDKTISRDGRDARNWPPIRAKLGNAINTIALRQTLTYKF